MGSNEESMTYDGGPRMESSLWDLRCSHTLVDTVLVAGTTSVPVHSVVLCARSRFFRRLVQDVPGAQKPSWRHPAVVFVDSCAEALMSVVRFLYFGEADVASAVLGDFLAVARKFELDGISSLSKESEAEAKSTNRDEPKAASGGDVCSVTRTEKPVDPRRVRRSSPGKPLKRTDQADRARDQDFNANGAAFKSYHTRPHPEAKKARLEVEASAVGTLLRSHEEPLSSDDESLMNSVSSSAKPGPREPVPPAPPGDDMEAVSSDEENLGVTTSRHLKPSLLESISSDEESRM